MYIESRELMKNRDSNDNRSQISTINIYKIDWNPLKNTSLLCQQGCKRNLKYNGNLDILTYDIKNTINFLLYKWLMF
jgi:hypothetical protein